MKNLKDLLEAEYSLLLYSGELFDLYPEATGEIDLDLEETTHAT